MGRRGAKRPSQPTLRRLSTKASHTFKILVLPSPIDGEADESESRDADNDVLEASEPSQYPEESSINPGHRTLTAEHVPQSEERLNVTGEKSLSEYGHGRTVDLERRHDDPPRHMYEAFPSVRDDDHINDPEDEPTDDMSAHISTSASTSGAYSGATKHGSALASGPGFGNKTAPDEDIDTSSTRLGTAADTSTYTGGTEYGSGTTAGPGVGNKAPPVSDTKDSTLGKIMEKTGGLLKNDGLVGKGQEKRQEKGADL